MLVSIFEHNQWRRARKDRLALGYPRGAPGLEQPVVEAELPEPDIGQHAAVLLEPNLMPGKTHSRHQGFVVLLCREMPDPCRLQPLTFPATWCHRASAALQGLQGASVLFTADGRCAFSAGERLGGRDGLVGDRHCCAMGMRWDAMRWACDAMGM